MLLTSLCEENSVIFSLLCNVRPAPKNDAIFEQ